MAHAAGRAKFDDGSPVANAEILFAVPGERVVLARTSTDDDGRFATAIPGLGRCEVWFVQDGLRFHALAEVAEGSDITVPTMELRVRVEPALPDARVTVASLESPPASFQVKGIPDAASFVPAFRDGHGVPFPGRALPSNGEMSLRLPRLDALALWASTPETTSNVARLERAALPDSVTLHLDKSAEIFVTVRDTLGATPAAARLSAFSADGPPVPFGVVEGKARVTGLRPRTRYRFRSEEPSFELMGLEEHLVDSGRTVELLVRRLTSTRFLVQDDAMRPIAGAVIQVGTDPAAAGAPDAGAIRGVTDESGRWTAFTPSTWGVMFVAAAAPPPGRNVGTWTGRLAVEGDHRIRLSEEPFTTLRVHPSDCTVLLWRKNFSWNLLPTDPIPLAKTDVVTITSGGRHPWKMVRAATLPMSDSTIELEPAIACRLVAPPEVVSLRIMEGRGGTKPLPGLVTVEISPGQFEVRGFAKGTRVGVVGSCDASAAPCTERAEFEAEEGLVVGLTALPPAPRRK